MFFKKQIIKKTKFKNFIKILIGNLMSNSEIELICDHCGKTTVSSSCGALRTVLCHRIRFSDHEIKILNESEEENKNICD